MLRCDSTVYSQDYPSCEAPGTWQSRHHRVRSHAPFSSVTSFFTGTPANYLFANSRNQSSFKNCELLPLSINKGNWFRTESGGWWGDTQALPLSSTAGPSGSLIGQKLDKDDETSLLKASTWETKGKSPKNQGLSGGDSEHTRLSSSRNTSRGGEGRRPRWGSRTGRGGGAGTLGVCTTARAKRGGGRGEGRAAGAPGRDERRPGEPLGKPRARARASAGERPRGGSSSGEAASSSPGRGGRGALHQAPAPAGTMPAPRPRPSSSRGHGRRPPPNPLPPRSAGSSVLRGADGDRSVQSACSSPAFLSPASGRWRLSGRQEPPVQCPGPEGANGPCRGSRAAQVGASLCREPPLGPPVSSGGRGRAAEDLRPPAPPLAPFRFK